MRRLIPEKQFDEHVLKRNKNIHEQFTSLMLEQMSTKLDQMSTKY